MRVALIVACAAVGPCAFARFPCGRGASAYFDGELATQDALGMAVVRAIAAQEQPIVYATGDLRFDCQSSIAVYQMALLGLGQILVSHPERREAYLPAMRHAAELMLRPETLRYAARAYGHDGVRGMGAGEGHAYLGYVNLGLGMLRLVDPETSLAPLHDRLSKSLAQRLRASPHGMIETYPGEIWPPDVAAVAGSIGLYASATHTDRSVLLGDFAPRFSRCAIDASGFLVQRITPSCSRLDAPRGSGTALASYFLAFADDELSRTLYDAVARRSHLVGGFRGVPEYPPGFHGPGDVNAGPILFGISVGATGFSIGAARMNGDRDRFVELVRSANLLGVPIGGDGGSVFATGGLLGNALLLAMLTAAHP
jgi:hypothetical protein